jgi:hypothetical protein
MVVPLMALVNIPGFLYSPVGDTPRSQLQIQKATQTFERKKKILLRHDFFEEEKLETKNLVTLSLKNC